MRNGIVTEKGESIIRWTFPIARRGLENARRNASDTGPNAAGRLDVSVSIRDLLLAHTELEAVKKIPQVPERTS